ncbi:hypothetical protein JKP88DRAFT_243361 [Tribonema minus]|uniref:WW domain-containing protein n=1 Tax=Tribonema minus TaxID=303371 RepID=A0A835Z9T9_9STRA|nr:hypothetical protein JKP88DRAFT_243361 [Tribonema minus]
MAATEQLGWGEELHQLQVETAKLLHAIRAKSPAVDALQSPGRGTGAHSFSAKKSGWRERSSAGKKRLHSPARQKQAFSENITKELLQSKKVPLHDDWAAGTAAGGDSGNAVQILEFESKEARMRALGDGNDFVPGPRTTLVELQAERARLVAMEDAQRRAARAAAQSAAERRARRQWLARDEAAAALQRVYRGHLGRRRAAIMRETRRLLDAASAEWLEVRDGATGDTWYYNPATAQSQWEAPAALAGRAPSPDRVRALPAIRSAAPSPLRSAAGPETSPPPTRTTEAVLNGEQSGGNRMGTRPQFAFGVVAEEQSQDMLPALNKQGQRRPATSAEGVTWARANGGSPDTARRRALRLVSNQEDSSDAEESRGAKSDCASVDRSLGSFFLPNGAPNLRLRRTVQEALRGHKFDSVSTLLAAYAARHLGPETLHSAEDDGVNAQHHGSRRRRRHRRRHGSSDPAATGHHAQRPVTALTPGAAPPTLFPVSADAPHPMVAVMAPAHTAGAPAAARRVQTAAAGSTRAWESGRARTAGLATRDVTTPGFALPPPPAAAGGAAGSNGGGSGGGAEASTQEVATPAPAAAAAGAKPQVCFNCWSAGKSGGCALHAARGGSGGGGGAARASESAFMCRNWDLGALRRRHRAEELYEIFKQEACSLKFDPVKRGLVARQEPRHPIYRLLQRLVEGGNFTMRRRLHTRNWLRGFCELIRADRITRAKDGGGIRVRSAPPLSTAAAAAADAAAATRGKMLRLRDTMQNAHALTRYARGPALALRPAAPVTGTTLEELRGIAQILVTLEDGRRLIVAGPMPVPVALYDPREYPLPAPITLPLADVPGVQPKGTGAEEAGFCPPATTVKFATLSRKPEPGNLAVGGLSAQMVVSLQITTAIPPQYGGFTVAHKASVAPVPRPEMGGTGGTSPVAPLPDPPPPVSRPLRHAMNKRRAPAITLLARADGPEEGDFRHARGRNRPHQTGEDLSHGFRTAVSVPVFPPAAHLDARCFTPSADVATANQCSANRTITSRVDRTYPFCEPSNRCNTTLDFYHLLLTADCSPNLAQAFINLGHQASDRAQEYRTDDGVPYWFDRRTGETFWERPLADEEKVSVKAGGTILDGRGEAPDTTAHGRDAATARYDQADVRRLMGLKHETLEDLSERRKKAGRVTSNTCCGATTDSHTCSAHRIEQVVTQARWARNQGLLPPTHPNASALDTPGAALGPPAVDSAHQASRGAQRESAGGRVHMPPLDIDGDDDSDGGGGGALQRDRHIGDRIPPIGDGTPRELRELSESEPRHARAGSRPATCQSHTDGSGGGGGSSRPSTQQRSSRSGSRPASRAQPLLPARASAVVSTIAAALAASSGGGGGGSGGGGSANAEDLIRLGLGLGMALKEEGFLDDNESDERHLPHTPERRRHSAHADDRGLKAGDTLDPYEAALGAVSTLGAPRPPPPAPPGQQPIGYGQAVPNDSSEDRLVLDHSAEQAQREALATQSGALQTSQAFRGLVVVGSRGDPAVDAGSTAQQEDNGSAEEAEVALSAPPDEDDGQAAAMEEELDPRRKVQLQTPVVAYPEALWNHEYLMHPAAGEGPLPEGFLKAIAHTHVATQTADYLPSVPNLPQAREPLSAEFISSLAIKASDLVGDEGALVPQTLLHVAAQNGNKRIAKLCLRRGANINVQNFNGQTPLHYAFGYGFESLGQYLISKGARDDVLNKDGLTCYEGLSAEELSKL